MTELFDDEPDEEPKNGTEQGDERVEYLYLVDDGKSSTREPFASIDFDEATEDGATNAVEQSQATTDSWNLLHDQNGYELNSLVEVGEEELAVPSKRQRTGSLHENEEEPLENVVQPSEPTEVTTSAVVQGKDDIDAVAFTRPNGNAIETHDEQTLFALSLVGQLKRLPPQKLAMAKCHILTYLMQLEYGETSAAPS